MGEEKKRIGIIGGGPSGLFIYKQFIEIGRSDFEITIFESTGHLGEGFPYSAAGANREHVTNVSGNEIPELVLPIGEWIKTVPVQLLKSFDIESAQFNDYKVLPRLLFGKYLAAQFELLRKEAKEKNITTRVYLNSRVTDICDNPEKNIVLVTVNDSETLLFDIVVLCTGHSWPSDKENKIAGYYDSPYPPKKLARQFNHPIAIRGASLTAIDAIRTLARQHGTFFTKENGKLTYQLNAENNDFTIVMHSRNGLLPAIRFHLNDSHLSKDSLLSKEAILAHMKNNGGFLSLDFIFEKDFKDPIRIKDSAFYERIKDMQMEEFVEEIMSRREQIDAFDLFKGEYEQAEKSIRRKESIYWKEMLAILSFAMNYPAKHLSAEDMLRLQKVLMPLISVVIAFVPQSSCDELIALHDAGLLELVAVGNDSKVVPDPQGGVTYYLTGEQGNSIEKKYSTYIDCVGQPHLSMTAFPFPSLVKSRTISAARVKFRNAGQAKSLMADETNQIIKEAEEDYYLSVPGVTINDYFQAVDNYGAFNDRLYIMAVPYIGGFNPDYSGLDFCEEASKIIVQHIVSTA